MADTVKLNKKPLMIAHRGTSGLECENTAAAFVAAGNRSYYGIETDVHITADGRPIIIHDDVTDRVSLSKLSVEGSTFDELRSIVLLDKDGEPRGDLRLPTLEEYLKLCKRYDKYAVLELKNPMKQQDIETIVSAVKNCYSVEKMIFISFSYENMVILRSLLPDAKLQFLCTCEIDGALVEKLLAHGLDLDIHYSRINKSAVELLHSHGIAVNCWTCDQKEDGEYLTECGVDFITSNILE
ncbi:MAG: hypothetical protein IJO96_03710 [Oscillospiraceae bacterium]|nr:hypothetical protein [Oscillospiraceae bacterium]